MARRHRRKSYHRPRRSYRRRTVARKAMRIARSVSRKMAAEVRKMDVNAIIPESSFTQITSALGTAADNAQSLPDYAYMYEVFSNGSSEQGLRVNDFSGNQIRAKYLYLGIHLQMPVRPASDSAVSIQQPVCIRVMVIQDRNYSGNIVLTDMLKVIFGTAINTDSRDGSYAARADYTLLPINPQQPGRFKVMRDFKMNVAPGYRMDYYKKITLLQRDMFSGGRFYAGQSDIITQNAPGDNASGWRSMRNRIYVLMFYQSPTLYSAATGVASGAPDFTVSIQSRLAFYDN